ncbi:MAG TPA: tetratricopeptide repeat protein [Ignavibacteriaceae bacterium]|nr:tetratricopeptide repeat protein [Ignavibacteriaceae bacterium]
MKVPPREKLSFEDRVNLIFEYNRNTPLFVRKANIELEKNNIEEAIEILTNGLNRYPNYAAAHILLGKAYTKSGNYSAALKSYKKGSELLNLPKTYEYYLAELNLLQSKSTLLPKSDTIEKDIFEIDKSAFKAEAPTMEESTVSENMIVSDTLAQIYSAQGEYKEAIKIYQKLIEKNPDKKDLYTSKIEILKKKLN